MSELQAVLFDMDGTVCDTEPAWMAAEYAMAAKYGAEWTEQDGLTLVGFSLLASGAYIKERMGLDQSPAEVVDELIDGVIVRVHADGVAWMPGALDLIEACNDSGVPTALVTMSYRNFAAAIVDAMPKGRFDAVIAGDEVANGKPHPEPYLAAAAALGVEASGCVAIEDSPTGATSAQAAGSLVVVVPNHVKVPTTSDMVTLSNLSGVTPEALATLLSER
jgi:HAD superfamily hydrolase (TIGR01509 family)